jgi:chromosome segregation protein
MRIAAETAIQGHRAELSASRNALDTARRQYAEDSARLNTLTELQLSHEGYYQGVKAVLNARARGEISGHYVTVVDILSVPEPYRVAIEVALGGSLQDIITRTEEESKAGVQWLKRNRAGRATFLPLPLLRPSQATDMSGRNRGDEDVKNAAEIVSVSPDYDIVAQLLLARVLVVESMDAAIAVSRRMSGWSKIVTIEGELLTPGGALTGGSLQGRGAHLIGRKGEIDDLHRSLPGTRNEVERLTDLTDTTAAALRVSEDDRNVLAGEISAAQAQLIAMDTASASTEREIGRMNRELDERHQRSAQLTDRVQGLKSEATRLNNLLEAGRQENELTDTALAALSDETRDLIEKRDTCRASAVALEVEVGRLKEKREGLTRAIATDRATLAALEQQLQQKSQQRNSINTDDAEAAAERESLLSRLELENARRSVLDSEFERCRKARQTMFDESQAIAVKSRVEFLHRDTVTKGLHDAELRLARLEIQISQAVERLHEEYGITREEALARPEDITIDRNTAMEVGRLRRELRAMGQVNTGAASEYDRLTERFEFLITQKNDLDAGRESLLQTIAEIDDSTRGVFMETFDAVKAEFQRIFCRLFGGGTTKLVLTDPGDLLETGIEVIAQPPGKKPQHLSLLSGGERALTATALLFAFLAIRPSPLVILDEVDAPLDGANVEKFTALVREFSQRSQFLLITHNPVTMEAAPTWYGVTMREAGVSSILSYRVPQESTSSERDEAVVISG